ncbi:hypothetical protein A2V49_01840 [candidate division WWE3 bacterium RBG_19FT_COMBO_34_6]|uniref:Glycosyltransferase RgtA/B/C/D-like domain-containing protein n=1 Tax=candidate division WWE3 bacterium RBG_19FT_COMBO_34_6 TaxID=1802612 RepID=A0A1F4UPM5_UNCKA|nr:MAG: hypothetical protein A2V49_01840 [candidate division WWE3 bacterium RBG_19FT_COMBO_34_6]
MSIVNIIFKNRYKLLLFFILTLSFILRFYNLGYSHFYGDETKVFYIDKTISASNFFLDQRKGPVQFFVSWLTEKAIGGFDEFYSRIPFALIGWVSIIIFYLVIKKLFNEKIALISTFLYAFNGFYIAFSRTVQYQSFLLLFGFLAIWFALSFLDGKNSKFMAISSAFILALAHLTHYDAIFFDIAIMLILIKKISYAKRNIKEIIKYYFLPFFIVISLFYIPYLIKGFYYSNTYNYVAKRLTGSEYAQNASWYTFWAYNPNILWAFLLVFVLPFFFKKTTWSRKLLLIWFLIPFIIFDYIILNPGTHIHNYVIPMIIIVSLGIYDVYLLIKTKIYRLIYLKFISIIFILIIFTDFYTFVPGINNGYPWKDSRAGLWNISKINKRFHLFLYGFPYQRGWDQIRDYVREKGGFRYIYTNDNEILAKYYLNGIAYSPPGSNYLPQYYIHIENSQEFFDKNPDFINNLNINYTLEKEFFVNGEKTAGIYKLIKK